MQHVMGKFEGFPCLIVHEVWVGNIMIYNDLVL